MSKYKIPNFKDLDLDVEKEFLTLLNLGISEFSEIKFEKQRDDSSFILQFLFYEHPSFPELVPDSFYLCNNILGFPVDGVSFKISEQRTGLEINKSLQNPYSNNLENVFTITQIKDNPFFKYLSSKLNFELEEITEDSPEGVKIVYAQAYRQIDTVSELVNVYSQLEKKLLGLK